MREIVAYDEARLRPGIPSRFVDAADGPTMHVLEAGFHVVAPDQRG